MTDALEIELEVECSAEHAFEVWARKTSLWWPTDHSVSGDPELSVTIEPRPGGRIFERTPAGVEHDWGEVVVWEPPRRLSYMWHIGRDRSAATEVEITFEDSERGSIVRIAHRGWDRLGAEGPEWRERNRHGWAGLLRHFEDAVRTGTRSG